MPTIKNLEARDKDCGGVFFSIHDGDRSMEEVRDLLRHIKFNLLTAVDDVEKERATKYGVKGYPTLFVIGRDGRIAWGPNRVPKEDGLKSMERAARALSIPWPLD